MQPLGIIPSGLPVITEATSRPSNTSFLYSLPGDKTFSHIAVFLMPNVTSTIPTDSAMAIYLGTAQDVHAASASGRAPNFQFLGGIGPGKESAIFKVGQGPSSTGQGGGLVVGVSLEPAASVNQRMLEVVASKATPSTTVHTPNNTLALAQSIIKNAFNFLASFSGSAGPGQVEVVPLKAFEEWWKKFEARIRSDPGFLERQAD